MKKFVIHSVKGSASIIEVEVIKLSPMECPASILQEGEWMGRIISPEFLFEKIADGKAAPPIWCWWAFYDSVELCLAQLHEETKVSLLRSKHKHNTTGESVEVSEEEISAVLSAVKIITT